MASRGSRLKDSDETFDFVCSPCNKKGKTKEAQQYCADCQEYLCEGCVDSHNSFSALAGHKLVGKNQFGCTCINKSDVQELPSVPTERCDVHSFKLLDMFCADHDMVGCHVCITLNHKSCPNLHYIPEFVQATQQAGHTHQAKEKLEKAISKLEQLFKRKQKIKQDNKDAKSSCLKEIRTLREEINQILDHLEQASVDEVEQKFAELDKNFQDELNQMQEMLDKLDKCRTAIHSSQNNASQNFVSTKISEKVISESEHVVASTSNKEGVLFKFVINKTILNFLQGMESLGKTRRLKHSNLYEIKSKKSFNVKLESDKGECSIWSSCILDSGDIVLADYNNTIIKLLNSKTYKLRHSLQMSDAPRSVCRVGSTEAAVSLRNKTIQFVSTENGLLPTRSMKFDHDCRGIAVLNGQILVCGYGPRAYIYTMEGNRLKTLEKDNIGKSLFSHIREVCVSDDGKMIHLADDDAKCVLTIDSDGNVILKYYDSELKSAWGICTDGTGSILVSGNNSNNVIQIGLDGKKKGEVIPTSYGLKDPRAVCFDIENLKLIVGCGNKVHVFLLE